MHVAGRSSMERARLLHFVVVGGGPTGVEFAGELSSFVSSVSTRLPQPCLLSQGAFSFRQLHTLLLPHNMHICSFVCWSQYVHTAGRKAQVLHQCVALWKACGW